jgi:hypothetical protein
MIEKLLKLIVSKLYNEEVEKVEECEGFGYEVYCFEKVYFISLNEETNMMYVFRDGKCLDEIVL